MNQITEFQGFVTTDRGQVLTDSRSVAKAFSKQHKNVLRSIDAMRNSARESIREFWRLNFEPRDFTDGRGKSHRLYVMTKDGFAELAMSFTGDMARMVRIAFIAAFNAMKDHIERGRDANMGEALEALADLKAQNQIGSFHGRGLARHKVAKPAKVRRFALAVERAQLSLSY